MWRKITTVVLLGGVVVAGSAAGRVHIVRSGETLDGIGRRYGVAVPTLAAANGLRDPNRIGAGAALTIPATGSEPGASPRPGSPIAAGRIHTVRPGETLEAIARRHGVGVAALAAANGLDDPDRVFAGAGLRLPAAVPGSLRQAPVPSAAVPSRPGVEGTTGHDTAVVMPPAVLTSTRKTTRIFVPADRAALRSAFLRLSPLVGVPSDLAMALAWQESGWQRHKVSSTRAVGVMQLMPDTVQFVSRHLLGLKAPLDPRDPIANVRMGTRFLRYLLDANAGNVDRALASYYQGLRSVRERGLLPETERFVANVKALRGRL